METLAQSIAHVERMAGDLGNWAAADSNWAAVSDAQHMFNVAEAAKATLPKVKTSHIYFTYFVNASPANRSALGVSQLCAVPHRSKEEAEAHAHYLETNPAFKCVHIFGPVQAAEPV